MVMIKQKLTLLLLIVGVTCAIGIRAQAPQRDVMSPIINYLLLSDSAGGENMSLEDASRFLIQTTFGPTYEDIVALSNSSFNSWIDTQMRLPATHTVAYADSQGWISNFPLLSDTRVADSAILNVMLKANDQLRQRVAYALSQIFVVSMDNNNGTDRRRILFLDYYDMLLDNAFGNYRDLLEEVTLNNVMGFYLTMKLNAPANTQVGAVGGSNSFFVRSPDENYAREIMQLFSVGLNKLNLDGTPVIANGEMIPSYTQDTIENFARVFTGWNYQTATGTEFLNTGFPMDFRPMRSWDEFHDKEAKTLLRGVVIPANQTAVQDLDDALDNIFNDPNVAPFISKLLIQHLVTSNPTPAYVQRTANVFNGNRPNGASNPSLERGNLGAVIKALLLDTEARNGHVTMPNSFGKFKEPFIRQMAMWRGVYARRRTENNNLFGAYFDRFSVRLGQKPLTARSVFNFYQSDFSPSGVMTANQLLAPESQLFDLESVIRIASTFEEYTQIHHDDGPTTFSDSSTSILLNTVRYQQLLPNDLNAEDLVERLNLVFMAGAMSDEMKQILLDVHDPSLYLVDEKWRVVIDLINIILLSPQYWVQK